MIIIVHVQEKPFKGIFFLCPFLLHSLLCPILCPRVYDAESLLLSVELFNYFTARWTLGRNITSWFVQKIIPLFANTKQTFFRSLCAPRGVIMIWFIDRKRTVYLEQNDGLLFGRGVFILHTKFGESSSRPGLCFDHGFDFERAQILTIAYVTLLVECISGLFIPNPTSRMTVQKLDARADDSWPQIVLGLEEKASISIRCASQDDMSLWDYEIVCINNADNHGILRNMIAI